MHKNPILYFLLILFFISGCTLQKRTYRKGYYVHWKSSENNSKSKDLTKTDINSEDNNELINTSYADLVASSDNSIFLIPKKVIKDSLKANVCGDSLWIINGNPISAKVLEITSSEIKYKRCSNLDGPTFVVSRSSVSKIKFSNGVTENYEVVTKTEPQAKTTDTEVRSQNADSRSKKTEHDTASSFYSIRALVSAGILVLSFILGIIFIAYTMIAISIFFGVLSFVSLILTWIFTGSALRKTRKDPRHYSGRGMASGALGIAIAFSALFLFALIIAILLLLILSGI